MPNPASVLTITLFVPGKLSSRLNGSGSRAHWSAISRASRAWRDRVIVNWHLMGQPSWDGPAAVTFTAYVGALWDDDNLPAAIKPIRDEAVRLICHTDDSPGAGHVFTYRQEIRRDPDDRGVLITVEPR